MPYVDENDVVKCDLEALYSGAIPIEAVGVDESRDLEVIGFSEGSLARSDAPADSPVGIRQNPPGWDTVDRICGD